MFGCLRRLGCLLVLLVAAGVAAWYFDVDVPWPRRESGTATAARDSVWEPVTDDGAARARQAVESLGRRGGPAYATVRPGDLASYFFIALSRQLPPSADSIEAAVIGDRVYVRANVSLREFRSLDGLGGLAGFLGDRERMQLGGRFQVIRPGLAQFLVEDVQLREFSVPRRVIPRLMREVRRGTMPDSVSENGLPFETPPYVADVRAGQGRVTIYKATE